MAEKRKYPGSFLRHSSSAILPPPFFLRHSSSSSAILLPPSHPCFSSKMSDPERTDWTYLVSRAMRKRRTWASLFFLSYALLLASSWNLILSIRSWYAAAAASAPSPASLGWPALYASVLYGGVFGLLSMGAALAIAIPATLVTWITVLVLLAFAGKPRRTLVMEGRRITADIAGFAVKILLREGNLVAAACAFVSFIVLILCQRGVRQVQPDQNL